MKPQALKSTIFFFFLFVLNTNAADVCPLKPKAKEVPVCEFSTFVPVKLDSVISEDTRNIIALNIRATQIETAIQNQHNEFAETLRYYRDDFITSKETTEKMKDLETDFSRMYLLHKQLRIYKRKLNYCYRGYGYCSAGTRVELETQVETLLKSQQALILKSPLFSTSVFDKFFSNYPLSLKHLKENKENTIQANFQLFVQNTITDPEKVLKFDEDDSKTLPKLTLAKLMSYAAHEAIQNLASIKEEAEKFVALGPIPASTEQNGSEDNKNYLEDIADKYPHLTQTILLQSEFLGERNKALCTINSVLEKSKRNQAILDNTIQGTLLLGPFLLGPAGRTIARMAEPAILSRVANLGLNLKKLESGTKLFSAGMFAAHSTFVTDEKNNECQELATNFYLNSKEELYQEHKKCLKDLAEEKFQMTLAWVGVGAFEVLPIVSKTLSPLATPKIFATRIENMHAMDQIFDMINAKSRYFGTEVYLQMHGLFTVFDLAKMKRIKDESLQSIPTQYWEFVAKVYNDRLALSPQEIQNFVKTSKEMHDRTKVIFSTEESFATTVNRIEFKGGIGIVESRNGVELLPLEKATGMKIPRGPYEKVVEMVRLTVEKDKNAAELSKDLIAMAGKLVLSDPKVTKIYIYTSKAHSVVYRRLGVPKEAIKTINDRDVYIELTRDDAAKIINQNIK